MVNSWYFELEFNTKNILYQTLLKTDTKSDGYSTAKANLKRYKEILRDSIKRDKMLYYKRTYNLYQNYVQNTCSIINETLQRKKRHELPLDFILNN